LSHGLVRARALELVERGTKIVAVGIVNGMERRVERRVAVGPRRAPRTNGPVLGNRKCSQDRLAVLKVVR
jgi:hypothetical protein